MRVVTLDQARREGLKPSSLIAAAKWNEDMQRKARRSVAGRFALQAAELRYVAAALSN